MGPSEGLCFLHSLEKFLGGKWGRKVEGKWDPQRGSASCTV